MLFEHPPSNAVIVSNNTVRDMGFFTPSFLSPDTTYELRDPARAWQVFAHPALTHSIDLPPQGM